MKVLNLTEHSQLYTANAYLVTGDWNTLEDVNTLIDVGRDPAILDEIENASTGVGKVRVAQVILTHGHYDHSEMLPVIRAKYHPRVYAFSAALPGVDGLLKDGQQLRIGDRYATVIYMPDHSSDGIMLYCEAEGVLFAGDTRIDLLSSGMLHQPEYYVALARLRGKPLRAIYFGHGAPRTEHPAEIIELLCDGYERSLTR